MVLVFAGLIQVFSDVGFSSSIIQHKNLTDADRSTAFWTNVGVGLLLTTVGVGSLTVRRALLRTAGVEAALDRA